MFIKKVMIKNFRSYQNESFEFGFNNRIIGTNGAGKSSIVEAIVWCLFGSDLTGTTKQEDRLVRAGTTDETRVGVVLEANGQQIKVERVKPVNGSMVVYVRDKKASAAAVEVWTGKKEVFLSAFIPGYFGTLEPKKAKEALSELLPKLSIEDVIATLSESKQLALEAKEMVDGLIDPDKFLENKRKELRAKEQELKVTEGRLLEVVEKAGYELKGYDQADCDRLTEINFLLSQAQSNQPIQPKSTDQLKQFRQTLLDQYADLKKQIKPIPTEAVCDECGSPLNKSKLQELVNKIQLENLDLEGKMSQVIAKGQEVVSQIEMIETENRRIQQQNTEMEHFDTTALEEEKMSLLKRQFEIESNNRGVEEARLRYSELNKAKQGLKVVIDRLIAIINAVVEYRIQFAKLQIEPILTHLDKATIDLFEVSGNGEKVPTFLLKWNNIPYKSLSTSEKIRCDIEIHNTITMVLGQSLPLFVDNAESVVRLSNEHVEGQLFAAYVKDQPLTLEVIPLTEVKGIA